MPSELEYRAIPQKCVYVCVCVLMCSGPMLVMALSAADNVVEKWRSLLGSQDVEKAAVLEPDRFVDVMPSDQVTLLASFI